MKAPRFNPYKKGVGFDPKARRKTDLLVQAMKRQRADQPSQQRDQRSKLEFSQHVENSTLANGIYFNDERKL